MGMTQKGVEKPQGGRVDIMTPLSLPRLSSCTAETGRNDSEIPFESGFSVRLRFKCQTL